MTQRKEKGEEDSMGAGRQASQHQHQHQRRKDKAERAGWRDGRRKRQQQQREGAGRRTGHPASRHPQPSQKPRACSSKKRVRRGSGRGAEGGKEQANQARKYEKMS